MESSSKQVEDSPEALYLAAEEAMNSNDRNNLAHAVTMGRSLLRKPSLPLLYGAKAMWLIANCVLLRTYLGASGRGGIWLMEVFSETRH